MTKIIKGIYENGKINLLEKPPKNLGKIGVYVKFVQIPFPKTEKKSINSNKFDPKKFKKALKDSFGAIPDLPSGIVYENRIRKKSEWERKYDW